MVAFKFRYLSLSLNMILDVEVGVVKESRHSERLDEPWA